MAFRARKSFGTFEKRAPVSCKYFLRVCRGLSTSTWKLGEATSVGKWYLCYVCRDLQLSRRLVGLILKRIEDFVLFSPALRHQGKLSFIFGCY